MDVRDEILIGKARARRSDSPKRSPMRTSLSQGEVAVLPDLVTTAPRQLVEPGLGDSSALVLGAMVLEAAPAVTQGGLSGVGRPVLPASEEGVRRRSSMTGMGASPSPRRMMISSNRGGSPKSGSGVLVKSPPGSGSSSPRSPHVGLEAGYKSGSDSGGSSPRLGRSSSQEGMLDFVLPISMQDVAMQRGVAKIRFKESDSKLGYSYNATHRLANGLMKSFIVAVAAALPTVGGAQVFLIDRAAKLGEGSAGTAYLCYELDQQKKSVFKYFKSSVLPEYVIREANNLFVMGDLEGYFCGEMVLQEVVDGQGEEVDKNNVYGIFMPFVPGSILSEYLYVTDSALKGTHSKYKDMPAYFIKKKRLPYLDLIDVTVTIIRALDRMHVVGLIHRDISCDNFMLENPESGRFIDFEVAVNVACDLYCLTEVPEKKKLLNPQSVESIHHRTGASYILCGQQLFYLNRLHNKLVEVKLSSEQLKRFDEEFCPTIKSKLLSRSDLERVTVLTGHEHLAPPFEGVNVAYGFAPPERTVSVESDYYMLGVVLASVVSGANLMRSLKEDYASKMNAQLTVDPHLEPLRVAELKAMMPDVFDANHYVCGPKDTTETYFYHKYVMGEYRDILNNLLSDDPRLRLRGSSLSELDGRIAKIRESFIALSEGYSLILDGLASIQKLGVLLSQVLLVIRGAHGQPSKKDYFFTKIDELLNIKMSNSVVEDGGDPLVVAMKRVTAQATKRQKLSAAISAILEGWDKVRVVPHDIAMLKQLLSAQCANGEAAMEFLQHLPRVVTPGEVAERRVSAPKLTL